VVEAVAEAHKAGVVHRDLKPDNVMIAGGHAMVVDFGVAKAMSEARNEHALTATGISLGSPAYMAPEQAVGDPSVDHRADIYALGVLTYEMLTGAPPFTGSLQSVLAAHVNRAPQPLRAINVDIPAALERIVLKCLEKDPAARYQTADALLAEIDAFLGESTTAPRGDRRPASRSVVVGGIGLSVVIAAIVVGWMLRRAGRERWVNETAIPTIARLAEEGDANSAFALANRATAVAPRNPVLQSLWPRFAQRLAFTTVPAGALVERAPFGDTTTWERVGTTPTGPTIGSERRFPLPHHEGRLPSRPAVQRWNPRDHLTTAAGHAAARAGERAQPRDDTRPGRRVSTESSFSFGPIRRASSAISWSTASRPRMPSISALWMPAATGAESSGMSLLSRTVSPSRGNRRWPCSPTAPAGPVRRPGKGGDIPPGAEQLPVGGLSGTRRRPTRSLPANRCQRCITGCAPLERVPAGFVVPGSRFDADSPIRGGSFGSMGPWGTFDTAGNMREWCFNLDARGKRYLLGGGWNDQPFRFSDATALPPFDRSPSNGVRLVKYLRQEPELELASQPVVGAFRDYFKEKQASDATFALYRQFYDYDRTALNAKVEAVDSTAADWIVERVSLNAAYGGERLGVRIYRPRHSTGPIQSVVLFPGSDAMFAAKFDERFATVFGFLVRNGRALVVPIYKSTFERNDGLPTNQPDSSISYRDHVVMWAKDARRTIDYLSSRADFDSTRIGFLGLSWGGRLGPLVLAVEPRFRAGILLVGGLAMTRSRPEADPFNFLGHVTTPVLMLNGKNDQVFPTETAQKPQFQFLGTAADRKRYQVFDGGHSVPRTALISESLQWFDRYLGPIGNGR
jgi:dienelactone hydrolase